MIHQENIFYPTLSGGKDEQFFVLLAESKILLKYQKTRSKCEKIGGIGLLSNHTNRRFVHLFFHRGYYKVIEVVSVARFTPYIVYGNFSFILDTIIRARFKFLGRIKRRLSERIERQIRFDKRFFWIIGLREPKLQICHIKRLEIK